MAVYDGEWWNERVAATRSTAYAKAPDGLPAVDEASGFLFSAIVEEGVRYFAFSGEADRDAFVSRWPSSEECDNPFQFDD